MMRPNRANKRYGNIKNVIYWLQYASKAQYVSNMTTFNS